MRRLTPEIWDGGIAVLLKLPAWTLPISIGKLIADFFRSSATQSNTDYGMARHASA